MSEHERDGERGIDRRLFMKALGATAGGVALGAGTATAAGCSDGPFGSDPHITYATGNDSHYGFGSFFPNGKKWVVIYRDGPGHPVDTSAVVKAADTFDKGKTLENERVIVDNQYDVREPPTIVMNDGRLGMVAKQIDGNGHANLLFSYSDDNGATWTNEELTQSDDSPGHDFHRYPASVGGADDEGFLFYSFSYSSGTGTEAVYTTNNGDTWNVTQATDPISGNNDVEVTVTRLGTEDKWIMLTRPQEGSGLNSRLWKSTDMLNWDGPYDTGQEMGENPLKVIYDDGDLYWLGWSRGGKGREIESFGSSIVHQCADADTVWNDPDAWPGWAKLTDGASENLGYCLTLREVDGQHYASFGLDENYPSPARLGIMMEDATVDGTVVDSEDSSGVTITGSWTNSTILDQYHGNNYKHDNDSGKGSKSVELTPDLPSAGTYRVYMLWAASDNRASSVPIDVDYDGGTDTMAVDQTAGGDQWNLLGEWDFKSGSNGSVTVRNDGTSGYVMADAVLFEPKTRLVDSDFEEGNLTATDWTQYAGGTAGVSDNVSNSGSYACYHDGPDVGGITLSDDVDTSNLSSVTVEYWARSGDPTLDDPEVGEDLYLEYKDSSGTWNEIDRLDGEPDDETWLRSVDITNSNALHGNFNLRFVREPSTAADRWYVDDINVY